MSRIIPCVLRAVTAAVSPVPRDIGAGAVPVMPSITAMVHPLRSAARRAGAAGVDNVRTREWVGTPSRLEELALKVREGRFRCSPTRPHGIEKTNGGTRWLKIPIVTDRVVMRAVANAFGPEIDAHRHSRSCAYATGLDGVRAAHVLYALSVRELGGPEAAYAIAVDLQKFFDEVPHDILRERPIFPRIDEPLRDLIIDHLRIGHLEDGSIIPSEKGLPQGSPISPALSEAFLQPLDEELERRGLQFVRYADDITIVAGSRKAAKRVFEKTGKYIERELQVPVNRGKSKIGHPWEIEVLGVKMGRNGKMRVNPAAIRDLAEETLDAAELLRQRREPDQAKMVKLLARILAWENILHQDHMDPHDPCTDQLTQVVFALQRVLTECDDLAQAWEQGRPDVRGGAADRQNDGAGPAYGDQYGQERRRSTRDREAGDHEPQARAIG